VQKYDYDAFGNILTEQDANFENPYTYTARERDKESGLYFYRARYLDPRLGRFLQPDPWPGSLSLPQSLNAYPYVGNKPTHFVDPNGRISHLILHGAIEFYESFIHPHEAGDKEYEQEFLDAYNESAKKAEETKQILKDMDRLTKELEESSEWMDEKYKKWLEEQNETKDPNEGNQTQNGTPCP